MGFSPLAAETDTVRSVRRAPGNGGSQHVTGTSPDALRPCRLHTASSTGTTGTAEHQGHLCSVAPDQCRNTSRSCPRSQTSGCRDRFLQRAAYLESKTRASSPCPLRDSRRRLSFDHTHWVALTRSRSFFPSRCSGVFFAASSLPVSNGLPGRPTQLPRRPDTVSLNRKPSPPGYDLLFRKDWVVYSKPPFGGPEYVLQYLGRYTHRVAISNHRLVSFADGKVTFRWRDSAHNNEQKLLTLSLDEFLRRFLLHVLPKGFVRIRNFGFLANRRRATLLPLCFQSLGAAQEPQAEQEVSSASDSTELWRCPKCGGPMVVLERLTAAQIQLRSPPLWPQLPHETAIHIPKSLRASARSAPVLYRSHKRSLLPASLTPVSPVLLRFTQLQSAHGCSAAPRRTASATPRHLLSIPFNSHKARVRRKHGRLPSSRCIESAPEQPCHSQ